MFLSDNSGTEIEKVVNILLDVEKKIDSIKLGMDQKKQELLDVSKEAAEKAKEEALIDITKSRKKALDEIQNNAEKDANKILQKNNESIKDLQKRVDEKFQDALEKVSNKVLGE